MIYLSKRELLKLISAVSLYPSIPFAASNVLSLNTQKQKFSLYDELYYVGMPKLEHYNIKPIHVAYAWQLWGEKKWDGIIEQQPNISALLSYAERYNLKSNPPELFVLNIEHWKLYGKLKPRELEQSITKLQTCVDVIRSTMPDTKFSIYNIGALPNFGHLERRELKKHELTRWQKNNDTIKPIIDHFDFVTPSLYFKKEFNITTWKRKAKHFISEARRLGDGKPVIPFIWPQYSNSLPFEELPGEVWKDILEFLYENSDSVILWRRHKGPKASDWNDNFSWWKETKNFLNKIES